MIALIMALVTCEADAALASPAATARQAAATALGARADAHSIGLLWTLSFDRDADVRQAALDAVTLRCSRETPFVCTTMLGYFRADRDADIADAARDALLTRDVVAALLDASLAYKQDVLERLASPACPLPMTVVQATLRHLVNDADAGVQEQAALLLERQP